MTAFTITRADASSKTSTGKTVTRPRFALTFDLTDDETRRLRDRIATVLSGSEYESHRTIAASMVDGSAADFNPSALRLVVAAMDRAGVASDAAVAAYEGMKSALTGLDAERAAKREAKESHEPAAA